jgi:DNA gyrase subunit B
MNSPTGTIMSKKVKESVKKEEYDANSIKELSGIEHVRARPGMYIGDVNEAGLHHLINEVVDNSIDEALEGHCDVITVTLHKDGSLSVEDNGRGIPVEKHPKTGKSALQMVLCQTNTGGKFEDKNYSYSAGLNGVGVACVNALSTKLVAEVSRHGNVYQQTYRRAVPDKEELDILGTTDKTGTKITFWPDAEIFTESIEFKYDRINSRLRDLSFLNSGLKLIFRKENKENDEVTEVVHLSKNGLNDFCDYLNHNEAISKTVYMKDRDEAVLSVNLDTGVEEKLKIEVEIAFLYNNGYSDDIRSYANGINTKDGGTHIEGFRTAFTRTFNEFYQRILNGDDPSAKRKKQKKKKNAVSLNGDSYRQGLICVVSVKVSAPQFRSQNKVYLSNREVKGMVQKIVGAKLKTWIEENPNDAKSIINKALDNQREKDLIKKAREAARNSNGKKGFGTPKKLADCSSNKPEECEVFLVEGDSAGGSARQGRCAENQAILPLRGKILNVWKSTPSKMLGHNEIQAIITALGTGILDDFEPDVCRYHKIIIMCDADVDGSHIRTLILTFLFSQMPELINKGWVYLACPPLYGLQKKGKKKLEYVLDDQEFSKRMHKLGFDDTTLYDVNRKKTIEKEELEKLNKLVKGLQKQDLILKTKFFSLAAYLKEIKDGKYPYARISASIQDTNHSFLCYSVEEYEDILSKIEEVKLNYKLWEDNGSYAKKHDADIRVNLFKGDRIKKLIEELGSLGYTSEDFFGKDDRDIDEKLLSEDFDIYSDKDLSQFVLKNERALKEDEPLSTLQDLPKAIIGIGRNLIKVKRYKGLGEMNAEELWDTTMDPEKRVLRKVTIEDADVAYQTFSTLMGNKVEPRRAFIEERSIEMIGDLDI